MIELLWDKRKAQLAKWLADEMDKHVANMLSMYKPPPEWKGYKKWFAWYPVVTWGGQHIRWLCPMYRLAPGEGHSHPKYLTKSEYVVKKLRDE